MILDKLLGIGTALAEAAESAAVDTTAAAAAAETAVEEVSPVAQLLVTLLPMVLIFVVFYFMLIRPQRKKEKQVNEMLNNLKKGDRVTTIGGIYGTVLSIKDDRITLSVGNQNMNMVVARWAIKGVDEVSIENDAEALN